MRLVEEARQRHQEADSVPAMVLAAGFVPRLCDALEDAEQEMKALRMALEISGERRETCERERERLRWFYDNMRMADRLNLQMVYEAEQHSAQAAPE